MSYRSKYSCMSSCLINTSNHVSARHLPAHNSNIFGLYVVGIGYKKINGDT